MALPLGNAGDEMPSDNIKLIFIYNRNKIDLKVIINQIKIMT